LIGLRRICQERLDQACGDGAVAITWQEVGLARPPQRAAATSSVALPTSHPDKVDLARRRRVDFPPARRSPALIWLIGGVLRMKMNHLLFRPTIAPIGAVDGGRSVPISS
jgi:hypothetical protein